MSKTYIAVITLDDEMSCLSCPLCIEGCPFETGFSWSCSLAQVPLSDTERDGIIRPMLCPLKEADSE